MYNTGTLIAKYKSSFVHSIKVVVWNLLDGILFNNKQLLDEIFVITRIIKVEVGVFRLRLITLTETLIIQSGYHKNRI